MFKCFFFIVLTLFSLSSHSAPGMPNVMESMASNVESMSTVIKTFFLLSAIIVVTAAIVDLVRGSPESAIKRFIISCLLVLISSSIDWLAVDVKLAAQASQVSGEKTVNATGNSISAKGSAVSPVPSLTAAPVVNNGKDVQWKNADDY